MGGSGPSIDFEAALGVSTEEEEENPSLRKTYDGIHWGNYKGQRAETYFGRDNMWDVESTVWRPDAFGGALIEEGVVDVEQRETEEDAGPAPWEDEG